MADLNFENHGTIYTMSASTPAGQVWVLNHIDDDAPQLGGNTIIEHRYAAPIIAGALTDGLAVTVDGREVVLGGAN